LAHALREPVHRDAGSARARKSSTEQHLSVLEI
jgi:hypothetical protein